MQQTIEESFFFEHVFIEDVLKEKGFISWNESSLHGLHHRVGIRHQPRRPIGRLERVPREEPPNLKGEGPVGVDDAIIFNERLAHVEKFKNELSTRFKITTDNCRGI